MKGIEQKNPFLRAAEVFHAHLIWWLTGAYAIAAVAPSLGLWIRQASLGEWSFLGRDIDLSMPLIMLAVLLFNSGIGVRPSELTNLLRRKIVLLAGLAANLLIPLIFILAASQLLRYWHDPGEAGSLIMGLALIASMPIAGSSAAWTQIANGDLALSIGLVTVSTLASPLTMPLALSLIALLAAGQYTAALYHAAEYGAGAFLWIGVVLPSLLGLLVRFAVGSRRIEAAMPYLKFVTGLILLLLNYSNAAISLPHIFQHPDPDYIVITLLTASSLCLMTFAAAYGLARLLRVDHVQEASILYGLGMNNNGMGLVLASLTLAEYPRVMLPIIFYNLIQHAVAASVHFVRLRFSNTARAQTTSASQPYSNAAS